MDLSGLCDICGKTGPLYSCSLCGKRVCMNCVTVGGACKACAGGARVSHDEKLVKDRVLKEKGIDSRL